MITIVAGTNRPNSRARRIAEVYGTILSKQKVNFQILDLTELPVDFTTTALYHNTGTHDHFNNLVAMAEAAEKLVFIVPEYNASFPGVLKAFIDGLPYPGGIRGKKAALVGLSSGGQGGLLPINHLTDVLMYLGTAVLPQRVRLPFIDKHLTAEGQLTEPLYQQLLQEQVEALLAF
ncbi:NAD(P)H-dependent oxidoreductase [Hymenobacter taeanensis]|uniref:NAD(P)H-dependent oxidoreductase n=1 Tax=Hymenobacter taeanensis TaxID=2735321 RepID=A0A6M6BIR2_9BACT|nr:MULTISPECIES: NAD(P)H-dependent oxidoreductase [Hymenobacter]QJX47889.1 NAD(P)H-dependent oxidoreductase [Hymenobacter taeanensis]UOQ82669.1 NAD(P)H-dependent oxidoreductase [Hymenobacter sp. 5414T-23]